MRFGANESKVLACGERLLYGAAKPNHGLPSSSKLFTTRQKHSQNVAETGAVVKGLLPSGRPRLIEGLLSGRPARGSIAKHVSKHVIPYQLHRVYRRVLANKRL